MLAYRTVLKKDDPTLTIRLPLDMVRDLVLRSEENGRDINVELAIRLARTLEHDQEMEEADRLLAAGCRQLI